MRSLQLKISPLIWELQCRNGTLIRRIEYGHKKRIGIEDIP